MFIGGLWAQALVSQSSGFFGVPAFRGRSIIYFGSLVSWISGVPGVPNCRQNEAKWTSMDQEDIEREPTAAKMEPEVTKFICYVQKTLPKAIKQKGKTCADKVSARMPTVTRRTRRGSPF